MRAERVLYPFATVLATACAIISGSTFLLTADRDVKGASPGPGEGYECFEFSTTYWEHPCACPIPAETEDFCSEALPVDGTTENYETGCTDIVEEYCVDSPPQSPCGSHIWVCNADCTKEPKEVPPEGWDCYLPHPDKGSCDKSFGCVYEGA